MRRLFVGSGIVLLTLILAVSVQAQKPVEIRLAVAGGSTITHFLSHVPQLTKHQGKSYVLKPLRFNSSAHQLQPLAAKELDIGFGSYPDFANAIIRAKLDLVIVADMVQDKQPYASNIYGVLDDGPVRTIEDLKGKVVAVPGHGTSAEFKVLALLARHGLSRNDVVLTEVRNPNMEAMLRAGKIHAGFFLTPFWFRAQRKGNVRLLFKMNDSQGDYQVLFQMVRRDFLKQHPDALTDFLEDYLRVTRWFHDPKNRDAAIGIAAKVTKVPAPAWKAWAFGKRDMYKDPNGIPDIAAIQRDIDWSAEHGYLPGRVEVAKFTDLSYVKKAAARLR